MPKVTKPTDDDSAGITKESTVADEPAVEAKVMARYVGIEPVLAHIDGEAVIIEPGDRIPVSAEQLEQNPVFESWED